MGRLLIQFPGTTTAKALTETLSKNVIIVDEDLHQLRLHDGSTAGGHLIGGSSGSGVPVGTIIPFAGNSIPQGYLLCDGSAISRTTYASLFAVIGTIYGAGDGNSTFNLPNQNDVHIMGVPNLAGYEVISTTNLSTTNTNFTLDKDYLVRVLLALNGTAVEDFFLDDCLMTAFSGGFQSLISHGVGFLPLPKGTHRMRTSSTPSRTANVIKYPFYKTTLANQWLIKYI